MIAGVLMLVGISTFAWIGWFYWHYHTNGAALVHDYTSSVKTTHPGSTTTANVGCANPMTPPVNIDGVQGVLSIPALGVTAPVQNGSSTSVLSDAVGHDPLSSWPNTVGTSVLFAHDVTWFSGIDALHVGSTVKFTDSCWTYTYSVVLHRIVAQATQLLTQSKPSIYLVTCWPSNALFYTPDRYVLLAQLVSSKRSSWSQARISVNKGPSLKAVGVTNADTLANNPTPMGYLYFLGNPAASFRQSPQALRDIGLVVEEFFYQERHATLPPISKVVRGLGVSLTVEKDRLVSAVVSDEVKSANGNLWALSVNERILGTRITSSGLQIQHL
ncbi:MAG: class D sortase [Gammaproteobacteria bacterium]|nr:class D sortase [Gammaproteobacteria bacterium]